MTPLDAAGDVPAAQKAARDLGRLTLSADQATGAFPIRILDPSVGDRRPLGSCAGSLALLAWMGDDEIDEVLARERHSNGRDHRVPEPVVLQRMIKESRTRGYTLYPGLVIPDSMGVGAPVFGADGTAVASLSVATIEPRMTEMRRGYVIEWLPHEAADLSDALLRLNPRLMRPCSPPSSTYWSAAVPGVHCRPASASRSPPPTAGS